MKCKINTHAQAVLFGIFLKWDQTKAKVSKFTVHTVHSSSVTAHTIYTPVQHWAPHTNSHLGAL